MSYIPETPIPVTSISFTHENEVMHGLFRHEKELTIEQEQTICLHIPIPNFLQNCALGLYSLNVVMYDQHQADITSIYETTIVSSYNSFQNSFFGTQNGLSNPWSYFNYSEIEFTLKTDEKLKGLLCESVGSLITVIQDGELRQFNKENITSYSFPQQRMLQYMNNIKAATEESGIYIYVREKEDHNNYYSSSASNLAKIVISYKREINNCAVHNILHMKEDSVLDVTRYLLYHNKDMILSNVKISFENSQISIPFLRKNQTAVFPLQSTSIKYSLKSYMTKVSNSFGPRYYPETILEIDNTSDLLLDGFQLTINNFTKRIPIRTLVKPKEKVTVPIRFGRPLQINNEYYFVNETNFNIELSDGAKQLILAPGERYFCDTLHTSLFGCANQEDLHPLLQKLSLEEIRWSELSGTPSFGTSAISCDPFAIMNGTAANSFGGFKTSPSSFGGGFGATTVISNPSGGFGTTAPNIGFGTTTTSNSNTSGGFGTASPTFGTTSSNPNSFGFGTTTSNTPNAINFGGFNNSTPAAANLFGSPSANSSNPFGGNNNASETTCPNPFDPTPTSPASSFGATTPNSNTCGGFGTTTSNSNSFRFGSTTAPNTSGGFGATTASNSNTSGGFGTVSPTFGASTNSFGGSGKAVLGSTASVNSFGGGFGTNTSNVNSFAFGATTTSNTSGGFGTTTSNSNSFRFGSTNASNTSSGFGTTTTSNSNTPNAINFGGFNSTPVAKNLFGSPSDANNNNNNTNPGESTSSSNPFAVQLFGYPASSPPIGFNEPPVPTLSFGSPANPPMSFGAPSSPFITPKSDDTIDKSSEPIQQSPPLTSHTFTFGALPQNNSSSNTNSTDQGTPSCITKEESNPPGSPK